MVHIILLRRMINNDPTPTDNTNNLNELLEWATNELFEKADQMPNGKYVSLNKAIVEIKAFDITNKEMINECERLNRVCYERSMECNRLNRNCMRLFSAIGRARINLDIHSELEQKPSLVEPPPPPPPSTRTPIVINQSIVENPPPPVETATPLPRQYTPDTDPNLELENLGQSQHRSIATFYRNPDTDKMVASDGRVGRRLFQRMLGDHNTRLKYVRQVRIDPNPCPSIRRNTTWTYITTLPDTTTNDEVGPKEFRRLYNIRETGVICRTRTSYQMIECNWYDSDGERVITD